MDLLLNIKHARKYLKSSIPDILYNIFFAKYRSNHYRFQLLVVSTTFFHPVWRGLDNIRSNPWSTRDKKCSTWETKITVPCRITATLPPAWAYTKLVFISMYSQSGLQNAVVFFKTGQRWKHCCCSCYCISLPRFKTLSQISILSGSKPVQRDTAIQKTETNEGLCCWGCHYSSLSRPRTLRQHYSEESSRLDNETQWFWRQG